MGDSASTDTFPADVAEVRRAAGITIAPEAALHRALQERTDELERVKERLLHETRERDAYKTTLEVNAQAYVALCGTRTLREVVADAEAWQHRAASLTDELERVRRERNDAQAIVRRLLAQDAQDIDTLTRERDEARAELERVRESARAPTAPDVGSTTSAPAAGAADPPHPGIHGRLLASMPIPVTHQGPARQIRRRTPDEIRAWAAGLFGG